MAARRMVASWTIAVALIGLGAAGGSWLHSPSERVTVTVARTTLTAPVESTTLTTPYTGSGTFSTADEVQVEVNAPAGMGAVVTEVPAEVGATVAWCQPVIAVSGRPVLVLHGTVPAYRDLTIGDTGNDVRQLQQAMHECGITVAVDGTFGTGTARALSALYTRAGHSPVTAPASALGIASGSSSAATTGGAAAKSGPSAATIEGTVRQSAYVVSSDDPEASPETTPTSTPTQSPTPAPAPSVIAPRGELLFVSAAPRLNSVAAVGTAVDGAVAAHLALAGDRFTIAFSAAQRAALEPGVAVTISKDSWSEDATLPALPDVASIDTSGSPTYPVSIPLTNPVFAGFYGQDGQFAITVGSPDPYDLVVPVSAIYQDTAGSTYVQRAPSSTTASTPTQRVKVDVLATANGYAAVRVAEGQLAIGDEVVVGD